VLSVETRCPFCGACIDASSCASALSASGLSRTQYLALAAALSAQTLSGCSLDSKDGSNRGGSGGMHSGTSGIGGTGAIPGSFAGIGGVYGNFAGIGGIGGFELGGTGGTSGVDAFDVGIPTSDAGSNPSNEDAGSDNDAGSQP
jgi:hypothetical protein